MQKSKNRSVCTCSCRPLCDDLTLIGRSTPPSVNSNTEASLSPIATTTDNSKRRGTDASILATTLSSSSSSTVLPRKIMENLNLNGSNPSSTMSDVESLTLDTLDGITRDHQGSPPQVVTLTLAECNELIDCTSRINAILRASLKRYSSTCSDVDHNADERIQIINNGSFPRVQIQDEELQCQRNKLKHVSIGKHPIRNNNNNNNNNNNGDWLEILQMAMDSRRQKCGFMDNNTVSFETAD